MSLESKGLNRPRTMNGASIVYDVIMGLLGNTVVPVRELTQQHWYHPQGKMLV